MTVTVAPARRAVIDLGAEATILDAARRVAEADSPELVLVVPAGAPLARNAVFLEVLRQRAGDRRIVIVSPEPRARSLAASVHMKAFSSLAALDRHELDATEHLSDARRAALATIGAAGATRGASIRRSLAVFTSLLLAAGILAAVIAPTATIVMSATPSPLGPYEYNLRAGPGGDINASTLIDDKVTEKATGTATGSRSVEVKATGFERFTNLTTNDLRIPRGTIVQTADSPPIRFQTTEERVLPRSTLLPPTFGTVVVGIEAIEIGTRGNVAAETITRDSSADFMVTNPAATTGGDNRKIPVVDLADYEIAVSRSDLDPKVKSAIEARVQKWRTEEAARNRSVFGYTWKRTAVSPPGDVVGREDQQTFEISVTGTLTAYSVVADQPKAAAIEKLKGELPPGMELDTKTAVVDIVIKDSVSEDGVHWRVRAHGQQFPELKRPQMTAALAGRGFEEVEPLAEGSGFHVKSISRWPSWWPRLPVLDSRITIELTSATAANPP